MPITRISPATCGTRAFDFFPIVRLQTVVFENNPASMRVLEKCGFSLKATHRSAITKDGVVMDESSWTSTSMPS